MSRLSLEKDEAVQEVNRLTRALEVQTLLMEKHAGENVTLRSQMEGMVQSHQS
jgi:hypothetical protein